jgi:uncharacterized membrane protein
MNDITLAIFAPLLILTGIAGFIIPAEKSLTSGAPAYNIFHIVFGIIGLVMLLTRKEWLAWSFNLGFGLIDLYQALASHQHLFPERFFRWTRADDLLHVVLGLALVVIGGYGMTR